VLTRREFGRGAVGSLLGSLALGRTEAAASRRPNVLLVMSDEWRAQALGYAGDPNAHTPVIDRFAGESVNFEQAVAGCSVCCPARASLLTGQYPLTHGVYINDVPLQPKDLTLGESFRNAGYRTAYIGKWHLYGSPDGRYGRREAYIPPESRFGFDYWRAAECTHDYNHSLYYEGNDQNRKYWPGYDALAQTADACQYVRENASSPTPFFLMLAWGPPHFPLHTAPEQYQAKYRDREIRLRPNVPESGKSKAIEELRGYYAHIAALDDCFKQLLDTLEATGNADDTVVVFTSDHGDMMQSQGLSYKLYPWEESIRVPLLIRYPRKYGRAGRRSAVPMNSPDLMPTLLGMSGIPVPSGVQGTDYSASRPRVRSAVPKGSAFLSLPVPIGEALRYGFAEYRGVRDERYTYARSINGPWLLYDNQRDPWQMRNLCGRLEAREIQARMDAQLNQWLDALDDRFLPAQAYLERDRLTHFLETKFPIGYSRSPSGDWQSTLPKPMGPPSSGKSAMSELLDDPASRTVLAKELPDLTNRAADSERLRTLSLWLIQQLGLSRITDAQLESIDRQLAALTVQ
jgi:arylsulfatase A-like enzyme